VIEKQSMVFSDEDDLAKEEIWAIKYRFICDFYRWSTAFIHPDADKVKAIEIEFPKKPK
jgi:hypothetical protein